MRSLPSVAAVLLLGACASQTVEPNTANLPAPASVPAVPLSDYRLGPLDAIGVNVFREPDLSVGNVPVALNGDVTLPLIGNVHAAGRTTEEVAADIKARLDARYLRSAAVAVTVVKSANRTVTVDGQVNKAGVYEIPGARIGLLQAIALGEGPTEYAKLSETVVIREIDGKRFVARFDVNDIRAGRFPDPQLQNGDIVVVGYSRATRLFRDLIAVLPGAAGVFIAINQ